MTLEQIKIVRSSWRKLMGIDPAILGDVFYAKLFAEYPALRRLFPSDMSEQHKKLIDMLTSIVAGLENFDAMLPEIRLMAVRHTGYGVKNIHYDMVGKALLWTLEKGLQNDWDDKTKQAWTICYQTLSEVMMTAASEKTLHTP